MILFDYLLNKLKLIVGRQPPVGELERRLQINELIPDDSMYLSKRVENYLILFRELEKNPELYNLYFKVVKLISDESANGVAFIIRSNDSDRLEDSEVIVKVSRHTYSDSLFYEYYIGTTLNLLRLQNRTEHFSLIYGKMFCGFDSKTLFSDNFTNTKLCDSKKSPKLHLVYEYMRNPETRRVTSFSSYIGRIRELRDDQSQIFTIERNIINIIIILMYTLQVAQDALKFTHYDLHTENIMVVELDVPKQVHIKYGKDDFTITTTVLPYIIDYGRCHVNPNNVMGEGEEGEPKRFYDESGKKYDTFVELQEELFGGDMFMINEKSEEDLREMENQLVSYIYKKVYNKELLRERDSNGKLGRLYYIEDFSGKRNYDVYSDESDITLNIKKVIVHNILNKNTINKDPTYSMDSNNRFRIKQFDMGIRPNKFNSKYDFFKLTKSVLYELRELINKHKINLKRYNVWVELDKQLDEEFPFYEVHYLSLPCDYHITDYGFGNPDSLWGFWMKRPRDIGRIFYDIIKDDKIRKYPFRVRQNIVTSQIGGYVATVGTNKLKKNVFDDLSQESRVHPKKMSLDLAKKNSDVDFVKTDEDVFVYADYVESDLERRIREKHLKNSPKPWLSTGWRLKLLPPAKLFKK